MAVCGVIPVCCRIFRVCLLVILDLMAVGGPWSDGCWRLFLSVDLMGNWWLVKRIDWLGKYLFRQGSLPRAGWDPHRVQSGFSRDASEKKASSLGSVTISNFSLFPSFSSTMRSYLILSLNLIFEQILSFIILSDDLISLSDLILSDHAVTSCPTCIYHVFHSIYTLPYL